MPGQLKIDQVGLPAGVAGVSRTDGLATGALVTITIVGSEGVNEVVLLWGPPDDTTAEASLAVTGDPAVWTFSPTAGTYGTYLIRLLEDDLEVDERVFGVRTPNKSLLIPALNERASKTASWANDGSDQVRISRNNAEDFDEAALNNYRYAGWWRSQHELYRVVDALVSGATAAAQYVLGAADAGLPNGRVATDSDEIEPQLGTPGIISWALKIGSVVVSKLENLTGLSVLGRASNSAGVMAAITATSSRQALMSNSAGTAIGWRSLELADLPTLPTPDWADVLAENVSSGANNPSIASGQHLAFAGGGLSGGDIRGADGLTLQAGTFLYARSEGTAEIDAATGLDLRTNNILRIAITQTGELELSSDPGADGQVLTSSGPNNPPTWATIDLSSVTYTAGDGLDLASNVFSIDVSDFAGSGLEDDGANNLRIVDIDSASINMVPLSDGDGSLAWNYPVNINDSNVSQGQAALLNFIVASDGDCDIAATVFGGIAQIRPSIDKTHAFAWTGVHSFTSSVFTVNMTDDVRIAGLGGVSLNAGFAASNTAANDLMVNALSGIGIFAGFDDASVAMSDHDISIGAEAGLALTAGVARVTNVANGIRIEAGAQDITAVTNGTTRLAITSSGELELATDPGEVGEVVMSAGSGAPPTWQLPIMPAEYQYLREDFLGGGTLTSDQSSGLGNLNWKARDTESEANPITAPTASEDNHQGILRLSMQAVRPTDTIVALMLGNGDNGDTGSAIYVDQLQWFEWIFRCVNVSPNTQFQVGLLSDPLDAGQDHGLYASWNTDSGGTTILAISRENDSSTSQTLTSSAGESDWFRVRFDRLSSSSWGARLGVNGAALGSQVTIAASPSGKLLQPMARMRRLSGGTPGLQHLDCDFYHSLSLNAR